MSEISVSDFLIQELRKIGVKYFFGVPGDYNFNILDSIEKNPFTRWVGCINELNAGYAADGYARINGHGAVVTTYNVGEFTAFNAIAGSSAENVPVILIVGMPPRDYIRNNKLAHHNFPKPDYFAAFRAFSNIVETGTVLYNKNSKKEIERVLSVFVKEKKPVYIGIPFDVCELLIENVSLIEEPASDPKKLKKATQAALKLIEKSKKPVIIGDSLVERFTAECELKKFIKHSGIPATTLPMGKGLINESNPNFIGTFLGTFENQGVYEEINKSDCVISVGTIYSDFNTLLSKLRFKPENHIEILGTKTTVKNKIYENVLMRDILDELSGRVEKKLVQIQTAPYLHKDPHPNFYCSPETVQGRNEIPPSPIARGDYAMSEDVLSIEYILQRFPKFLKTHDCIFSETGTFNFMVPSMNFPDGCVADLQILWASIGWATPACFGAALANEQKRIILLTGEGSHQQTFQDISNIISHGLKPKIFILNNCGYTVERVLAKHPNGGYNDTISWDYTKLFESFNADAYSAKVRTNKEFDEVLNKISNENRLCYVELFTDKMDIPPLLRRLAEKLKTS